MLDRENAILNAFSEIESSLNGWGKHVDDELSELLEPFRKDNSLKIQPKFRLKDRMSFLIKALYRDKCYADPILQIEDKIGTRIVMLTTSDVEKVTDLIKAHRGWQYKIGRDYNDERQKAPELFAYQSMHLTVWPNSEYLGDPELVKKLTCEIQIRTLLQHAYAEISHDSSYKGPYKNDREMLRILAKSMALMESTDEYFCRIFDMMTDPERKYSNYLNELIQRFKRFAPNYTYDASQSDLIDSIFSLLKEKDVHLEELTTFISKNENLLKGAINSKNGFLFQQPTILLIAYYLEHWDEFLERNWPLSSDALDDVYQSLGVSRGHY